MERATKTFQKEQGLNMPYKDNPKNVDYALWFKSKTTNLRYY